MHQYHFEMTQIITRGPHSPRYIVTGAMYVHSSEARIHPCLSSLFINFLIVTIITGISFTLYNLERQHLGGKNQDKDPPANTLGDHLLTKGILERGAG